VAALYAAYIRSEQSPLAELPIQYADFAHWQRTWLQGEVLSAQLAYWLAELAGAPTVIDLAIDKPRPPVQTFRGAHHPLQLSAELSAQLQDLSRRHGSTLFITLLAAFHLLLCRYAGQEQVLVGSPIANRNRSETEGLIGCFVNTLVLRGDVRGNPTFGELLRRVRETALGAYAHQDLPFEKLVEELQPKRDLSRSPLIQVWFVQNIPIEVLELEGLRLNAVESAGKTARFELSLGFEERNGMIVGGVDYNLDLFEAETIGRLVTSYERILQAVVADAEQRVLEIELLSAEERQQIVEGWNETRREYRGAVTLQQLFEEQAQRSGEVVATVFEGLEEPIANLKMYLLDRRGELVPVGAVGELHTGGVGLGRSYPGRPELTAERFIPDPFSSEAGARLYRTGDLACYRANGNIEFLGRMDHQIKGPGFRIELGEIESVLSSHPEITENLVLVQQDTKSEKRLVAYIVSETTPSSSELRDYVRERLPEYMVPQAFVSLPALPLTSNGGIDRRALHVPPRNEVERVITNIWQEVLGVERIGIHDNFFDLGGHSLLAVQIHLKITAALQCELSIIEMFKYPTVDSLATFLTQKVEQATYGQVHERVKKQLEAMGRQKQLRVRTATHE
jgi:acyl carrier protein